MPSEALKPTAQRLANLLGDAHGAEILAEMQRLAALLRDGAGPAVDQAACSLPAAAPAEGEVGIWLAERLADGVALRRRDMTGMNPWHWADVSYVPPAGDARRVVLIGESVARGWGYDPAFNPTMALSRQLDRAAPGDYQCVDLGVAGATAEALTRLVDQLPAMEPDVVILFAGNNWVFFPESASSLATAGSRCTIGVR